MMNYSNNYSKGNSYGNFKGGSKSQNETFMESYQNSFDFEKSLSLEEFEKLKWTNKKGYEESEFTKIDSNSGLRKIYDSYIDIIEGNKNKKIQIDIRFAKIGYQEKRSLLPSGFLRFLEGIRKKIPGNDDKKYENFKDFLEVFVAYHKYFNPNAK